MSVRAVTYKDPPEVSGLYTCSSLLWQLPCEATTAPSPAGQEETEINLSWFIFRHSLIYLYKGTARLTSQLEFNSYI